MLKRYLSVGALIIFLLVSLVVGIRKFHGVPKALENEPAKVLGPANASVFIVEFSDFVCPYCKNIDPVLKDLHKTFPDDLKIIFKHYPLRSHPPAFPAAEASECAADQGKFWEYHDILFERVEFWYSAKDLKEKFMNYAKELGLDTAQFKTCLDSHSKKKIVESNRAEGNKLFVSGTPTLLLNGRKVLIDHKPDHLKEAIKAEIGKNKK